MILFVLILVLIIFLLFCYKNEGYTEVGDEEFPLWIENRHLHYNDPLVGKNAWVNELGNEAFENLHGEKGTIKAVIKKNDQLVGLRIKMRNGEIIDAPIKDYYIENKSKLLENVYMYSPTTQSLKKVLKKYSEQKDYYGPSWDGIEAMHWDLAKVTNSAALETPGWYKYESSTQTDDMDGKDWRIVIPVERGDDPDEEPYSVINAHSLIFDDVWTLNLSFMDTDEIDPSELNMISDPNPWIRSIKWSIELAKILQSSGYSYEPAISDMEMRLSASLEMRKRLEELISSAKNHYRELIGKSSFIPSKFIIRIDGWSLKPSFIGSYYPPENDEYPDYGIITIDKEALKDPEYAKIVLKHELVHSLFNESCNKSSHHKDFKKIATAMGIPSKYQN